VSWPTSVLACGLTALIATLQSSAFATERAPLSSTSNKPAGSTTTPEERIAAQCPHAEIANQELARQLRARQPDIKTVTRPAPCCENTTIQVAVPLAQVSRRWIIGITRGTVVTFAAAPIYAVYQCLIESSA
jgi:hypothetical protein